jgi:type IV pilus assembly protein PilQ
VVTPGPATGFALSAPTTADATAQSTSSGPTTTTGNGTVATTSGNQAAKATTYMLLLTGTDVDIKRALDILAEVDVQPAQIAYDAKITEINLNDTRQLGLNWDFSGATTRIGEMPDEGTANSTVPTLGRGGNVFKFGVIGRTPISSLVNVSLDALFSNSNTKVLADPNISAVDGQQAAVFIGDTIYYVSSIAQTATGPTVQTASVSVGIKLFVAGKVSNDGYVTVNLHPEVSTISSWLSVPGGGQLPQISNREATTTVRVKDGDYIAIGGLINEQDVKTIQKVPGLGDIPFFGSLFRNTQNTHQRDEIVIFVKVSIDKNAD